MNALLRTEQLAIGYQVPLIPGFDLALPEGQLVALLGVNGIGKSTLLRTLAGLQQPLQGRALINDTDLHRLSAAERARTVSVVLTERMAPPLMDVRTLVALGRQPWTDRFGALTAADRAHVERALEQAGVQHLAARALDACSDGERQKAFIARAIAQDTPLLLLDEPTAYWTCRTVRPSFAYCVPSRGKAGGWCSSARTTSSWPWTSATRYCCYARASPRGRERRPMP